jgi:AraC-like DNA-binding protein
MDETMTSEALGVAGGWRRMVVTRIEDWADGVLGAGLEVTQMSRGAARGSLAFAEREGITYSSGYIGGRVGLAGPLSQDRVTIGVGLAMPPGSREWLNEIETGAVGVFMPGDEHDALYAPGSLYATVTLDAERLEAAAAHRGLVLDVKMLGGTGIDRRKSALPLDGLCAQFLSIHAGNVRRYAADATERLLDVAIGHFARAPRPHSGPPNPEGLGRVVASARAFIEANLEEPLSIDAIAVASYASRRTLFRAFTSVLGETPAQYVRRRRLHRIRHDLASWQECACTIAMISNRWGMSELGRMAHGYREVFGERPSETLRRAQEARALRLARSALT